MSAFSALNKEPGRGRSGWKETVKLRLILILLKYSLQVLIPKDYTESQDLAILSKMSKWHLTEVQSFLHAGILCWCIKYKQFFCTDSCLSPAPLHQWSEGVQRLCYQKGSLPIRKAYQLHFGLHYQSLLFSFHQYLGFSNDAHRKGQSFLNYCPSLQVKLHSGWGRDRGQVVKCLKRAVQLKSIFLDESSKIIRWIQ